MNNYYKELGLNTNATKIEIKSAYRLLAKKYHPDTGGNNEKFLALQLAWETLSDPDKKSIYDQSLLNKENSNKTKNEQWSLELKKKKIIQPIKMKILKNG